MQEMKDAYIKGVRPSAQPEENRLPRNNPTLYQEFKSRRFVKANSPPGLLASLMTTSGLKS